MGYAKYVGRVGALAVALGIGAAVASTPGVAWADETDSGAPPPASEPAQNPETAKTSATPPESLDLGGAIERHIERVADHLRRAITGVVTSSGGAITSTHRNGSGSQRSNLVPESLKGQDALESPQPPTDPLPPNDEPPQRLSKSGQQPATPDPKATAAAVTGVVARVHQTVEDTTAALHSTVAQRVTSAPIQTATTLHDQGTAQARFAADIADTVEPAQQITATPPAGPVVQIVSGLLAAIGLNPAATNSPVAPLSPQTLLGVLELIRREIEHTFFNQAPNLQDTPIGLSVDEGGSVDVDTLPEFDGDGDRITYSVAAPDQPGGPTNGTVTIVGDTITYTPDDGYTGPDSFVVTASDAGSGFHLHGFDSIFNPRGAHTDTISVTVDVQDATGPLPEPHDVALAPTERPGEPGVFDTTVRYDPTTVANVSAAPGFEPKYYRLVSESYDPVTGEYKAVLKATQAGMLLAGLEVDTPTDFLTLQVTPQPTGQTFALRSASFAALADDPPDEALRLPPPPGAVLRVDNPAISVGSHPAGVVVTDKFAYVINSGDGTVTVIGADPNFPATYNKVLDMDPDDAEGDIDPIVVGVSPTFAALVRDPLSGDRLYVLNAQDATVTIINTRDNSFVDADEVDLEHDIDPIAVPPGSFTPLASPDGKRVYLVNQQAVVYVIDTDPQSDNYNELLDLDGLTDGVQGIEIAPPPDNDPTDGQTFSFSISGGFSADGNRLYVTRDYATQSGSDFAYNTGDVIVIDTASNTVVGDPIALDQYPGYVSSKFPGNGSTQGDRLYLTSLDPDEINEIDVFDPNAPAPLGYVTVVDIDPDSPTYNTQIDRIDVGLLAVNVALSPDGSLAYAVNAGDGTISVIDTVTNKVITGFPYDPEPFGHLGDGSFIAISPDGNRLYITRYLDGEVAAVSIVPKLV